jgi:RHS repeat-associated protein
MKTQSSFFRMFSVLFAVQLALPASLLAQLIINPPTFPNTNTVRVTLSGAASTNAHVILWTPDLLGDLASWYRVTTGTVGQTTFDLIRPTNQNSFLAAGVVPVTTLTVATPIFTPGGGTYSLPTNVTITCATDGALIYYTTDGNTPTVLDNYISSGATVYLDKITTLKAKAFKNNYNESSAASATYNINSAPFVFAGTQQVITASSTTLQGVVMDDGSTGGGTRFTNWSKISGPGSVSFANTSQTNTPATFGSDGIYLLQLSASDGQYTNSSQVTIGVNPTISVSLTAPGDGSSYVVPTNILLQAAASCTSGSVTQVLLYANSTLIGEATGSPLSLNWKSVSAGNLALRAVAITDEPNNLSLASDPVNITVNWPTNVGQVTLASTDLQIPVAGLPIAVNWQYDSRGFSGGSLGVNGRFDWEIPKIESDSLSGGWEGFISIQYCVRPTLLHLVTVSLSENEKYYFVPRVVFNSTDSQCINAANPLGYYDIYVHPVFDAVGGQGQLSVSAPANLGLTPTGYDPGDGCLRNWSGPLKLATFEPDDFETCGAYATDWNPSLSDFTFTAQDGTRYGFNADGTLASKTDRNGNALTYSSGGIAHSSGKQIAFTRDGNNYITEIYDPIALDMSGSPVLNYAYDGNGNLTNVARLIQRSPAVYENTAYAYTNASFTNNLTVITDPRGIVSARYEYDASGRLTKNTDALGRSTSYYYDTVGHRLIITDRAGNTKVQTFTDAGQLASVSDASGGLTSYAYDERGRKIAETNPAGETTTFTYDQNDNLSSATNALSSGINATYNDFGQPLLAIDARGYGTTNEYDANGNLVYTANALGTVGLFEYDVQGNRITETNAAGLPEESVTRYEYDTYGYLTKLTDSQSNETVYTYDANGNKLTETKTGSAGTQFTQWSYDAANRQLFTIDAGGFTNRVAYNGIGKPTSNVDALGRTNQFFYDAIGLLTNTIYTDALSERFGYDVEGRKTSSVDRAGRTTTYSYDALGRLIRTTYPDGNYTGSGYDAAGRLVRSIQAEVISSGQISPPTITKQITYFGYDAAGRRVAVTNALGAVTRFEYDANGNQTNIVDALGRSTGYDYDALNRQTKITCPDGTSESTGFDGLDRKVAVTNQAGIVTRFGFDALARLIAVTNAFGTAQAIATRYVYDGVGNLLQQIDALNRTNKFEYDALGRRTKEIVPGSQTQTFGYDAIGNLTRLTNFNGSVISNQFNALNRLTNRSSVNGYKITFAYSATGQRTNMVDASGTNTYTYDDRDRLLTKATPQGTLTYTYDGFGNLTSIQSSTTNGTKLAYSYDSLNRLTSAVDRFTNNTLYAFDGVGNLQTVRYQNNVTNTYAYNTLNRLTNVTAKTSAGAIASFAYRLASDGSRTNLIENINGTARTNAWSYDPLYRLTNEVITGGSPTGTISYKYDAAGNRTNRTSTVSGVAAATNSFNNNDQMTADTYDSNGSTTASSGNTYAYDVENHLTNYNSGAATFVYDGDGNRVRKTVSGVTTYYLVGDRNPTSYAQVLEEVTTVGSTPSRLYTYGLDLVSQRQSDGTTHFYGYDGNGNVRFLTATNATISDTYAYDAFGIQIASTGTTPNNYKYSGEQYDSNLGFYYLRARYLNPNTGRFWTRDSFDGRREDPRSLHRYLYAFANPLDHSDPSGHDPLSAAINGQLVHKIIGNHFVANGAGRIYGPSVGKILSLNLPGMYFPTIALFPDLVDMGTKEIYEIKPLLSFPEGVLQLAGYIEVFNYFDPAKGWRAGSEFSYVPPSRIDLNYGAWAIVYPPRAGVILYDVVDLPALSLIAIGAVVTVSLSQSADLGASIGIVTLNALLGAF